MRIQISALGAHGFSPSPDRITDSSHGGFMDLKYYRPESIDKLLGLSKPSVDPSRYVLKMTPESF